VGGGFVMVPLQVMVAGVQPLRAVVTSLVAIVPISIVGALVYYLAGAGGHPAVDLGFAGLLVVGGMAGAYLGARLAPALAGPWLSRLLAIVLALVGFKELIWP
jgi:uncharacterized membrane protein YfcA